MRAVKWTSPNKATCHPDRPLCAKELCRPCYNRRYNYIWGIRKEYGLTPEQYNKLRERCGDACEICGAHLPEIDGYKKLMIDHSHETGAVRGLLCTDCNKGIGFLKDSPKLCILAAQYLERFV